ncbi:MAG TPA: peptide MFS transporter [Steroidobacteraceae bacterium]|jgi:POT family proton-dependent oligopeptide transporter
MTTARSAAPTTAPTILGHPKGLFYLAFTEAWERFSYYGMIALLVLYMVNQLLLPGHVENIIGFAAFRSAIESVAGPMTTIALASQVFGLYAGFVYFTPMLGGLVADRWLGQRTAVVIGALCMCAGHLAMAFDQTFLFALLLLVTGSGLLKGNISAQVGALYPLEDEARRTRGFAIFSMGINVGAVFGPIVCGALAAAYGWHYGFGAAAVFMLAGLATYLYGYRHLPARVKRLRSAAGLATADWRIIGALLAVMLLTVFQSVSYYQLANILPVWIQEHVALGIGTWSIPIPWFQSIDPLASVVAVPVLFGLWKFQAARRGEPDDLGKIAIGAWLAAASNLFLIVPIIAYGSAPIPAIWPVLYCIGMGVAFLYYWPTLLALVSCAAPAGVNATMMGVAFLSLFLSNMIIGWLGRFYEPMGPLAFWVMHAAIAVCGALLVLVLGRPLRRILETATRQPLRPSAMTLEVEG